MKNILTILFIFYSLASFSQPVNIKETLATQYLPIEYKITGGDSASMIVVNANNDLVQYSYLDVYDNVISTGSLAIDTDRPFSEIKTDLFTSLSITDLATISFTTSAQNTGYRSFGNLINRGWPDFAWSGGNGTTHLANRDICTAPYNSFTRTFGSITNVDVPNSVIGTSSCIIDDQIYYFACNYTSDSFYFFSMSLYISTDLTGSSWSAPDTLLWRSGTHGGVNETTYPEFNFYGIPLNITGQTWIVPWYEFNESRTIFLLHYLYTENNFDTWEIRDIPTDIYSLDENYVLNIGQDTLIAVSRNETNSPMMGNISTDGGDNWNTWKLSNLGSYKGKVMGSVINTPEYGIVCVYADRGTGNIMISKGNSIKNITTYPYVWNPPDTLYNTTVQPALLHSPLGYPVIVRVAQYRYMIAFSIEISGSTARLYIGDGRLP